MRLNMLRNCTLLKEINTRIVHIGQILLLPHVSVIPRDFFLIESELIVIPDILIHFPFVRFLLKPCLTKMSSEETLGIIRDSRPDKFLSFSVMVSKTTRLRRNFELACIWIEFSCLQMEISEHLVYLAGCIIKLSFLSL